MKGNSVRNIIAIGLVLALTACSGGSPSSWNPFNWGRSNPDDGSLEPRRGYTDRTDYRPLAAGQITRLRSERTLYGTLIHVTALMPSQGYYDLGLVEVPATDARELVYELRAWPPKTQVPTGTTFQREVTVVTFVSKQKISGFRQVRVTSAVNSATARP